jgi:hypothetical protein
MQMGRHFVVQSVFANDGDHQLTSEQNHVSSAEAKDCDGHEWAVGYCKLSHKIKHGLQTNQKPQRLCVTWLAWGFQVSFMSLLAH